jgi:hypothetical protein
VLPTLEELGIGFVPFSPSVRAGPGGASFQRCPAVDADG